MSEDRKLTEAELASIEVAHVDHWTYKGNATAVRQIKALAIAARRGMEAEKLCDDGSPPASRTKIMSEKTLIQEHVDRCLECYAQGNAEYEGEVTRDVFELMRGDLLIAIGMLMALCPKVNPNE